MYVYTYIQTDMHACIHTYVCIYIHAYIHTYMLHYQAPRRIDQWWYNDTGAQADTAADRAHPIDTHIRGSSGRLPGWAKVHILRRISTLYSYLWY
jgi:hypothetical protein